MPFVAECSKAPPPRYRVGDLVRLYGDEYLHLRHTTPQQRKVLKRLGTCRTEELGGFLLKCDTCDYRRPVYNPCRDRHCPSCEGHAAAEWLQGLRERILPCHYFHVVFTLPAELRWLAFQNASFVYALLLRCAGETLTEITSDPKHLGAQIGVTTVLHTWRSDLNFHPHVHCLVTAGGLDASGSRWLNSWGERYLAPNRLFAARFREKLLRQLGRAHARGELRFAAGCKQLEVPEAFAALHAKLSRKQWLVYAKSAFRNLDHLLRYLARYTHRIGISDRRLANVTDDWVTFATRTGDEELHVFDFLSRFLLHVLPSGFVKIRHYGLFATPARGRLEQARNLLQADSPDAPTRPPEDTQDLVEPQPIPCPQCLFGILEPYELPLALPEPPT